MSEHDETGHDGLTEFIDEAVGKLATRFNRRSLLAKCSAILLGALGVVVIPELPVDRRLKLRTVQAQFSCEDWYLCGIYGALCTDCGGGPAVCPDGTAIQQSGWSSCCNDGMGNNYSVTYDDCCNSNLKGDLDCDPFCANGSSQPAWCGGLTGYQCTVALIGGEC